MLKYKINNLLFILIVFQTVIWLNSHYIEILFFSIRKYYYYVNVTFVYLFLCAARIVWKMFVKRK